MKSCSKVKNPCKYCQGTVNKRNGLQCMGACKKWAHFSCLNYTPGKIDDIKAGIIKVTCPCPDCETKSPKEFVANTPLTCSNHECPANKPKTSPSFECPISRNNDTFSNKDLSPVTRKYSPSSYSPPSYTPVSGKPPSCYPQSCSPSQSPTVPTPPTPLVMIPKRPPSPSPPSSRLPASYTPSPCPHRDTLRTSYPIQAKSSTPLQKDSAHRSFLCSPIAKSPSCSVLSYNIQEPTYNISLKASSATQVPPQQDLLMSTLQDMCNAVGKLTFQIKSLMEKMRPKLSSEIK